MRLDVISLGPPVDPGDPHSSKGHEMATNRRSPLEAIPGVGPSLSRDLQDLGFSRVGDLKGEDPETLYQRLCHLRRTRVDPCVLYVFRCAVYFAGQDEHDPELLKWWNWKDRETVGP